MPIINQDQVVFVLDGNDKKSSVVGIETWDNEKKKMVVDQQVVPRSEGIELGKMLKKRQAEQNKLARAAGQPIPSLNKQDHHTRIFRAHNGRPVSMEEIMSVKKRSS